MKAFVFVIFGVTLNAKKKFADTNTEGLNSPIMQTKTDPTSPNFLA